MSMSERRDADPALDKFGPRPTDAALPLERRTIAAPYVAAIVVVLLIGLAILAFGIMRFSESTERLQNSSDAAAPTENLLPGDADAGAESLDRLSAPASAPGPAQPAVTPDASDVPAGN